MDENSWFDPGDKELGIDRVRGARIGMMICFDWVFPEVARTLALAGADVICHPSDLVLGHCQQAMLTRSLENGVFSVTANRFGTDRRPHGEVRFTGRSQIVGPRGELLFRAPAQRDVLQVMEIDPARARDKAITPRNQLLKDRRPQFYA
jgi:predicted amidohydrolase